MASMTDKAEQRLGDDALPGERVLYGVLAFRTGGVRKTMVAGATGVAGAAGAAMMAAATSLKGGGFPAAPLKVPGRMITVLTDRRLLVYSIGGAFAAKPGKLLHAFPLDRVVWLPEPELIPGAAQALRVQIGIAGEGVLGFEFPRLKVNEGRNMINRLRRELPPEEEEPPEEAAEAAED
ncbi:hypothetical protein ABZ901_02600 [Actinacidiphila alni]|uniref:hypothetical protein n=1 Tax=Actinacidiphila alni TaxID=380248 RepID=UPI0033CC3445